MITSSLSFIPPSIAPAPAFQRLPAPIIIIGMHRSGTSLMAGILHLLGIYVDPALSLPGDSSLLDTVGESMRQNGYGEAVCFRLVNEAILARAGATWNHVTPFLVQRGRPRFQNRCLAQMRSATYGVLQEAFLTPLPSDYTGLWGWKDPRNTLTLPYWLALFPDAKVIHVRRNPEDIATSLIRRAQTQESAGAPALALRSERWRRLLKDPQLAIRAAKRRLSIGDASVSSPRSMLDRSDCLALSDDYLQAAAAYPTLGEHYLEMWYEDIVQSPENCVQELTQFLALSPSAPQKQNVSLFVKPNVVMPKPKRKGGTPALCQSRS